jgi:hypothetical protein
MMLMNMWWPHHSECYLADLDCQLCVPVTAEKLQDHFFVMMTEPVDNFNFVVVKV